MVVGRIVIGTYIVVESDCIPVALIALRAVDYLSQEAVGAYPGEGIRTRWSGQHPGVLAEEVLHVDLQLVGTAECGIAPQEEGFVSDRPGFVDNVFFSVIANGTNAQEGPNSLGDSAEVVLIGIFVEEIHKIGFAESV